MPEGECWVSGGEAAIVCPCTRFRASGRSEVPTECGLFLRSWLLLSTCSQRDRKICHPLYFSQWQGLAECYKEIITQAKNMYYRNILRMFLSCWFDVRWNFEEQPRISLYSAPNDKIFTVQINPLKQFWMHILASSCVCTPCLFRDLSFARWGSWVGSCRWRKYCVNE